MTRPSPIRYTYEIRVQGVLDQHWNGWFDGLCVRHEGELTIIGGPRCDEPALHAALAKCRDLGLHLVSVRRVSAA
jgi:hypothetical protein